MPRFKRRVSVLASQLGYALGYPGSKGTPLTDDQIETIVNFLGTVRYKNHKVYMGDAFCRHIIRQAKESNKQHKHFEKTFKETTGKDLYIKEENNE